MVILFPPDPFELVTDTRGWRLLFLKICIYFVGTAEHAEYAEESRGNRDGAQRDSMVVTIQR